VLDLCAPFLLNAQHDGARRAGVGATLLFHFLNYHLFDIGIFPFLGAGASVLFLTERELESVWASMMSGLMCCRRCFEQHDEIHNKGDADVREVENIRRGGSTAARPGRHNSTTMTCSQRILTCLLCLYALIQLLLPVRHFAYHLGTNETVNWTGEGEQFGWRMMLTSKRCTGHFTVLLRDGQSVRVETDDLGFTLKQEWRVFQDPARYTWQVAHFLRGQMGEDHVAAVYAQASCSLNGGPVQPYINASVDLLKVTDDVFVRSRGRRLWLPQRLSI
jgi:hypothetical protein